VSAVPEWLAVLAGLDEESQRRELRRAPRPLVRRLFEEWGWQAHGGQVEPEGEWRVWLIMAGRGFGKTRAGAEWVSARARANPGARIALVGATLEDVVKVMIEGESGLKAAARTGEVVRWRPSRGEVEFPSGATGFVYSGERPEKLRGPQHHFAWCDEIAKWRLADTAWDNLMLGLRLGEWPRAVVTTTPRPGRLLKRIRAMPGVEERGGRTAENLHLPSAYVGLVSELYGGTRLGRQELDGVLMEEAEGSLWPRALIERCRVELGTVTRAGVGTVTSNCPLTRVVIGVDPPASAGGDACGIVAAGIDSAGIGYVIGDHSVSGLSPEGWARRIVAAAEMHGAERVVVETNQGGEMVTSLLAGVDAALPVKPVHARFGKAQRAEPVALRFEAGKAKFAGVFPELEDELAGLTYGGGYEGPGRSPDRADAMVYALTELLLARPRAEPRVRFL
jgi:phage terminase large subunit-like protein